jgi:hypothetical protein
MSKSFLMKAMACRPHHALDEEANGCRKASSNPLASVKYILASKRRQKWPGKTSKLKQSQASP